jgi:hypothetical protein
MSNCINYIITIMILIQIQTFAQKSTDSYRKDKMFGFFIGLNNNQFNRGEKLEWNSIIKTFSPGINTGLHFRPYSWGVLSSLIQLSFSQKGATELFNVKSIEENISVRTNLNYGQIEIIPLEFTPFPRKNLSPYISGGMFFSRLISSKIRYQYNENFDIQDDINHFILDFQPDQISDIGYSLIAGLKLENFRIELRNEFGSKILYNSTTIRNNNNSIIFRFSL